MRYTTRKPRSYTDAEGDGYWPEGECSGFDAFVADDDGATGVLNDKGEMLYREMPRVGFDLTRR